MIRTVHAEPHNYAFDPTTTALMIINMQRDFVDRVGFGPRVNQSSTSSARPVSTSPTSLHFGQSPDSQLDRHRRHHRSVCTPPCVKPPTWL